MIFVRGNIISIEDASYQSKKDGKQVKQTRLTIRDQNGLQNIFTSMSQYCGSDNKLHDFGVGDLVELPLRYYTFVNQQGDAGVIFKY